MYDERTNDNRQVFPLGPKTKAFLVIDGPVTPRAIGLLLKYIALYAETVAEENASAIDRLEARLAAAATHAAERNAVIDAARVLAADQSREDATIENVENAEAALVAAVHALEEAEATR